MRRWQSRLSRLAAIVALAGAFAACASPFGASATGQVVVKFGSGDGAASRAPGIPVEVTSIEIAIKAPDMATILVKLTIPSLSATIDVPAGAGRSFEVLAKDSAAIPIYRGKTDMDITAGAVHELAVSMAALFALVYDKNAATGGTVPLALYREAGAVLTVAPNSGGLVKAGYAFNGWNTASDGSGTPYTAGAALTMPAAALTLYAQWQATKEVLSFNLMSPPATGIIAGTDITLNVPNGTNPVGLVPTIVHNGSSISPASGTSQDFTNPVAYTVTAADSSTKIYTVTVAVAPSTDASLSALVINPLALSPAFSPSTTAGYTATANGSIPTVSVTPTATDPGATIQVKMNTGTYLPVLSGSTSGTLMLDDPVGVNLLTVLVTASDGFTTGTYTATITKTASLTVNYGSGGTGSPIGMSERSPGEPVNLVVSPDAGYSFSGWTGDILNIAAPASVNTVLTMPLSSVTIFANFSPNSYDVTFNPNGGGGGMGPQSILFNSALPLTANAYTYPGFVFAGWAVSPSGPVVYADGAPFTMNVLGQTLYAQWTAMVTYNSNMADVIASPSNQTVYSHTPIVGSLPAPPVKAGHDFAGWSTALNDGTEFTATTMVTGTMTVYAMWSTSGLAYTLINGNTEYSVGKGSADTSAVVSIPYYWLGKKVTAIDSSAFSNCTTMTGIVIPGGVTIIGDQAFEYCTSLASVTLPPNITTIGASAFRGMNVLSSLTIPATVTSIGASAFAECTVLNILTVNPITPPFAGADLFLSSPAIAANSILVPAGSVSAYQIAAGWSTYVTSIGSQ